MSFLVFLKGMQGAIFRRKAQLLEATMNARGYSRIPSELY
jgi:hypothetical protein